MSRCGNLSKHVRVQPKNEELLELDWVVNVNPLEKEWYTVSMCVSKYTSIVEMEQYSQ